MKIPEEFKYLATCFYSRSDLEHATAQEWVGSTVKNFLPVEKRKIVKKFLDGLLSGEHSDDDLQRVWENLDSDYRFRGGADVRTFFTMIRDMSE